MAKKVSEHKRRGGVPSRDELYRKVANKASETIDVVYEILQSGGGKTGAVRLGAAKLLLNKVLPDLRMTELTGDTQRPIGVVILPEEKINYEQPDSIDSPTEVETSQGTTNGSLDQN